MELMAPVVEQSGAGEDPRFANSSATPRQNKSELKHVLGMIHTLVRATAGWSTDDCTVLVKIGWYFENCHAVYGRPQQITKTRV